MSLPCPSPRTQIRSSTGGSLTTRTSTPRTYADPNTGRTITQLTSGDGHDYPLYYFIPTTTDDGESVVFHRHQAGQVQLYRLDISTGQTVQLTNASTPNALWRPWLWPESATGVRDQLSAFNTVTNEAIYYDGNELRAVHIHSLEDRLLHTVPEDRTPCSLTGVSPDGRRFVFAHIDRAYWEKDSLTREPVKHDAADCRLELLDLQTGDVHTLVRLNTWITHANFYDNTRVLLCHLATERAILLTDLNGGWYTHLRTQDDRGSTCHYQSTEQGITYEVESDLVGVCDPDEMTFTEYDVDGPAISHIGYDPTCRLWVYETRDEGDGRAICFLPRLETGKPNQAELLLGPTRTWGINQTSHLHPRIMPDRKHLMFTGGDPSTETNHLCLLDVGDLTDTQR